MDLSLLHFARPAILWGLIAIPILLLGLIYFYQTIVSTKHLEKFIDKQLLPYLVVSSEVTKPSMVKSFVVWSLVWTGLTLALAGPRVSFREIETFSKDQTVVILLDLSESMNAADAKPSRLIRAKQKIEDILNDSRGVKIGLIAFAADPHMIAPITDDKETIRHLLPSLDTDLPHIQGSKLSSTLDMAYNLLEAEPGSNKSILVISDGGFEDSSALTSVQKLAAKGITLYTMGMGTEQGAPLKDKNGSIVKKNGVTLISKLEKNKLVEASQLGKGRYLQDSEEGLLLKDLASRAEAQVAEGKKNRFWGEHFYLAIIPCLPLILLWFRKGHLFAWIILFFFPISMQALPFEEHFKNSEEKGKIAFEEGNYELAQQTFQDPYRKGVASYKAGIYAEAEACFKQSMRDEVACSALYNLGNALAQQGKIEEAIQAYEKVLERWPDHKQAKENLEFLKKKQEEKKKDKKKKDKDKNKDKKDPEEKKEEPKQSEEKPSEDPKDKDESKDQHSDDKSEDTESESKPEEEKPQPEQSKPEKSDKTDEDKGKESVRSQEDLDADLWLNQITNDPKNFLKNKFYIESKKNGTAQGVDPW